MKQVIYALLGATMLAGCASSNYPPPNFTRTYIMEPPPSAVVYLTTPPVSVTLADQNVLFWNDAQRVARFRDMESWFAGHEVQPASNVRQFGQGAPLSPEVQQMAARFISETKAAGLMVIEDEKLRHEAYGLGFSAEQRWTSFSVAKSFTSTLLGAALKDGSIASLDDSVTTYIPQMAGSEYEAVTVRQLATMTSGVRWNENYGDPESDVAKMASIAAAPGEEAIVTQMKALPREAPPGEKFVYKTGETNLLGVLVARAVGTNLATYAKTKIVEPAGFASPLFWMIDASGRNIGGCCLSVTLGDYARMGQFALDGGEGIVPDGWFAEAGGPQISFGNANGGGFGYGYQWWTYPGGAFGAQGIFGQAIMIVPDRRIIIAVVSNWPQATSSENRQKMRELVAAITAES